MSQNAHPGVTSNNQTDADTAHLLLEVGSSEHQTTPYHIKEVILMTTKEQELKALARIKAIVEELGPDSYIGTAFEGCFEIAKDNIDNDFACSMKQRAEATVIENSRLRDMVKELEAKLAESEKDYEAAHEAAHIISDQKDAEIAALREKILSEDDLTDCIALIRDRIQEDNEDMAKAEKDIVNLADNPSSTGFQRAVSQHRGAKHSMEYCEALRGRIQKALNAIDGRA